MFLMRTRKYVLNSPMSFISLSYWITMDWTSEDKMIWNLFTILEGNLTKSLHRLALQITLFKPCPIAFTDGNIMVPEECNIQFIKHWTLWVYFTLVAFNRINQINIYNFWCEIVACGFHTSEGKVIFLSFSFSWFC